MKKFILFILMLSSFQGFAQNRLGISLLDSIGRGDVVSADFDGDSDIDLIISGLSESNGEITKVYLNNGNGLFTDKNDTVLIQVDGSSLASGDLDNDGDVDIIVSGSDVNNDPVVKAYINSGNAEFAPIVGQSLAQVSGHVLLSDIDGDNDLDLLISGDDSNFNGVTKLYTNDGNGSFTEMNPNPLPQGRSSMTPLFVNIDNDSDMDLIFLDGISLGRKVFQNNGSGVFTEVSSGDIERLSNNNLASADIDGDNDQDLIIGGEAGGNSTILYLNDGNGLYTENTQVFPGLRRPSFGFEDLDSDGDQDLVMSGEDSTFTAFSAVYLNDGSGNFSLSTNNIIAGYSGDIELFDADGDNDVDIFITGFTSAFNPTSALYLNDGQGNFSQISSIAASVAESSNILIYPNPTTDKIYVKYQGGLQIRAVKIANVAGLEILLYDPSDLKEGINIKSLAAGMYHLVLEGDEFKKTVKFIKE